VIANNITQLKQLFIVMALLGLSMACNLITPSGATTVTLSDCYQVSFLGYTQNTDQVSTWRYGVKELSCAQDLSNWMLELPACAILIDASPSPWEVVQPDPNYHFDGIKWQTGTDFQNGEFTLVLSGQLTNGMVQVGVKGPDVAIGTIEGPICPMTTITPALTGTPSTNTPTLTTTAENTPTPTEAAPAPTVQAPASSGTILITENDQTLNFTCNGNAVEVRGNANVVTLLGSCSSITVRGNGNQVYWQSGSPIITDTGNENIISQR
jgi:hypothetical protein